jgi:hypothetical protein
MIISGTVAAGKITGKVLRDVDQTTGKGFEVSVPGKLEE